MADIKIDEGLILRAGLGIGYAFAPFFRGFSEGFKRLRHFNSRPCVRGDTWTDINFEEKSLFQFTPLREGRLETLSTAITFV